MENEKETSKPGVKTTEFWVSLAPVFLGMVEAMKGDTSNSALLIICATVLGGLYMISRTIVKKKSYPINKRSSSK